MQKPDIWKAPLICGAISGFLSGVPFLGAVNCLCCSLIVGGGVLSSYMLVKASQQPVTYGQGAISGLLTGLFAGPSWVISSFLFTIMSGTQIQEQFENAMRQAAERAPGSEEVMQTIAGIGVPVMMLLFSVVIVCLSVPFATLGGVLGRAIFEKRTIPPATDRPMMPPPPTMS